MGEGAGPPLGFPLALVLPESPTTGQETRLGGLQPCGPRHDPCQGLAGGAEGSRRSTSRPCTLLPISCLPVPSGPRGVGVEGRWESGDNGMHEDSGDQPSVALISVGSSLPGAYLGLLSNPLPGPHRVSKFCPRQNRKGFPGTSSGPHSVTLRIRGTPNPPPPC